MKELILLYWGVFFLMHLSAVYYPATNDLTAAHKRHFLRERADVLLLLAIAWMTCFSFLRTSYNDTHAYINGFRQAVSTQEFISDGGLLDLFGNPLSYFYQSLIRDLTDNYHIYFFFPAFFSSYAVVKLCKRYSVSPALSLLIFFSVGTYVLYMAALKQCFAMFFVLMALPYAIDRKYGRFYLLVFTAMLFHAFSVLFAFIPLLFGKPWSKRIWVLCGVTLLALATYGATLGAFMEYAESIGVHVAEEELFDGNSVNVLRVVVYWIPPLVALFFRKRLFADSTRAENLFVNLSIVCACVLTIGLGEGANLYGRMAGYFEIATAIALPWMIQRLFDEKSAKLVTLAAGVLYFGYFLYEFSISKGFGSGYRAISLWDFIVSLV